MPRQKNTPKEEALGGRVSNTKDLLTSPRHHRRLFSLWDVEKWDVPWSRSYGMRSWKVYRKSQYKTA